MTPGYASLRELLAEAGYTFVEPPIVHPASVFVELLGEDLRRRLLLTSGADGVELALRPDYTIPVCLHHLAAGPAKRRADYAYLGPVFRIRAAGPSEFHQAGIESLGRTDRTAADADVLKLAFEAAALLGVSRPRVRVGDSALFAAALDALSLNAPWQRRLERTFGDTKRLKALIKRANGDRQAPSPPAEPASKARVRRRVAELFAATGLGTVGGRLPDEIAERYVEKQVIAGGIGARAATALAAFLDIAGTPAKAADELRALARSEKLDIATAIGRFEKRVEAFATHGIDVDRLMFAADFGRRLDYYTGFVFEFHAARGTEPLIGGGRYDRMMGLIARSRGGEGESVPAVGFAIWLDRVPQA
jgi:ATP phosphoribosyltransferase regulatory subunit